VAARHGAAQPATTGLPEGGTVTHLA